MIDVEGRKPLEFVDTHQHFQDLDNGRYPWLSDRDRPPQLEGDLEPIRRNYLPGDYIADTASARVSKVVHVQNGWDALDSVGETRWLQTLATSTGMPTAIVAYADLSDPCVEDLLMRHRKCDAVRGIRQILSWHEKPHLRVAATPDLIANDRWRRGFALLRRYNLSFDLQLYWPQMSAALNLARSFPDTKLVLTHFGMPIDRSAEGVKAWSDAMAHLAQAPNVMVKLSGFGLGHPSWSLSDTVPLLRTALAIFGPDRTMVGTNLPVERLFAEGKKIISAIEAVVEDLSSSERQAVLTHTAERFYRLTRNE